MSQKRTKIPRASFQVGVLDDEDFIVLTEREDGYRCFGIFAAIVILARDMEINPVPYVVIKRRLGLESKEIQKIIKIISKCCFENGNNAWLVDKIDGVLIRSFSHWNAVERRGGKREGAGRKPENKRKSNQRKIKNESKSDPSVSVSVTVPATSTVTEEEERHGGAKPTNDKGESSSADQCIPTLTNEYLTEFSFATKTGVWTLPEYLYEQMQQAYGNVDSELKKAQAWCLANKKKRKTDVGMPRFLNSWLSRNQKPHAQTMQEYEDELEQFASQFDD